MGLSSACDNKWEILMACPNITLVVEKEHHTQLEHSLKLTRASQTWLKLTPFFKKRTALEFVVKMNDLSLQYITSQT